MAELTQSLLGGDFLAMSPEFICTLMVFCIVLEAVSVIIGHLSNVGN